MCESGHKLNISHYEPYKHYKVKRKDMTTGKTVKPEIIYEWLSNKKYRQYLTNQFCEFLRATYEHEKGEILNTVVHDSNFCPICSLELNKFDVDDMWIVGLKCNNNHTWYSRNGIRLGNSKESIRLDITENCMNELKDIYLKNNKYYKDLPTELVALFK